MPDRRSAPDLQRTLSDLYPTPLASDPSELADQTQTLFQAHARAHDRSLTTHKAAAGRLNELEGRMRKVEISVLKGMTELKDAMKEGFADVKLERTIDRTKQRTTIAVLAVVWSALMGLGGAAFHYLTKPSCRPDQAMIGDRCVEVQTVTVKK